MKYVRYYFLLAIALSSCKEQESKSEVASDEKNIVDEAGVLFKRNTLLVADLERSLKVYKDILGYSFSGEISELDSDSYAYGMFKIPKEGKIRFIALNSPSQQRTLALTEVTGVEVSKSNNSMASSCMVMRVDDFEAVMQKIKALELETTELQVIESEKSIVKEQAFYDFDGHLVDLYYIENKKQ